MRSPRIAVLLIVMTLFGTIAHSQVTSIPSEAKSNFASQYPNAQNIKWSNDIVNVNVRFEMDGEKLNAEYNNKGIWRQTFKTWAFDRLPAAVREGYEKSRYADRSVTDVKIIYYPGNIEQYRLKVEKNDLQKKYLFFNAAGRLVRESIAL